MNLHLLYLTTFVFLFLINPLLGQDSTKTYKLKEITISGEEFAEPKPVSVVKGDKINNSDANSFSEVAKYIPSLKLQHNSRGESQFFLRGYGVRQLALFFDDVPLSIPWDNRIDLSLIPTQALNSITIFSGTPSVLFGANTLGGVISIESFNPDTINNFRNFSIQFGSDNYQNYSGNYSGNYQSLSFLASFSYNKSGDYRLPNSIKDVFSNSDTRLNSESNKFAGFVKLNYKLNDISKLSFSSSFINAQKGVPPEMDVGKPRFWKYPLWDKWTLIFNGDHNFTNSGWLKYSLSFTKFKMKIDQFTNSFYSTIDDYEEDNDYSFYGRAIYSVFIGSFSELNISTSGLISTHKEKFLSSREKENLFSQNIFSLGTEYEIHQQKFSFLIGMGIDNLSTPKPAANQNKRLKLRLILKLKLITSFLINSLLKLFMVKKPDFQL